MEFKNLTSYETRCRVLLRSILLEIEKYSPNQNTFSPALVANKILLIGAQSMRSEQSKQTLLGCCCDQ